MFHTLRLSVACVALMLSVPVCAADVSATIKAAVSDSARPAADTQRDDDRKPAEIVAFAGVKPGDTVADISPGSGYFTRILSQVVGKSGKVYGVISATALTNRPDIANGIKALEADPHYGNIALAAQDYEKFAPAAPLDVIWISLIYHDIKNRGVTEAMNKAFFAALKPGGTYLVIDHAAEKGSGARDSNTLHRIDPALVKQEVLAAGFILDAESPVLAHAGDNHTTKVFDGAIRGKTDQFIYKFKKPAN